MAEESKESKPPEGIYPTRVDLGPLENGADTPSVPVPENPPPAVPRPEVPRSQWEPKFSSYLRSQGRGKIRNKPKIKDKA